MTIDQLPASPHDSRLVGMLSKTAVPVIIGDGGQDLIKTFLTFFTDQIRNHHTREAYYRNASSFFHWCSRQGLAFSDIESFHVSAYIELLRITKSDATVKQHLASIKMLFDWMVIRQMTPRNPAAAVRGPRIVVSRGKTPVMDEETARQFFDSFARRAEEAHRPLAIVELRDRAFCATMTYAMPRVSSVCSMLVGDYYPNGKFWWLRFAAKGGKYQEMPVHHKLVEYLDAYLDAAGIAAQKKTPLFRSAFGRTGQLTDRPLRRENALAMVKRRARDAGIQMDISNHTFRGTGITNYMKNGGQLNHAQNIAGHSDPRTTRLYDHSGDQVTFDEIERIHI